MNTISIIDNTHALTHACTHARTHARTHTHTYTHTHKYTNLKLYKSKEGKTITIFYTFCVKLSDEREGKK